MKNHLITLTAYLTLLFLATIAKAGDGHKLKYDSLSCLQIEGKILNAEDGMDGECKVELIQFNEVVDSVILKEGKKKFKFVLSKNSYYAIRVSKKGYISKLVSVNTEIVTQSEEIYKFTFETNLIKEAALKRLNRDVVDFPVAIIHFDYENDCFSYNKEYTVAIKKELRQSNTSYSRTSDTSTELASASEE
jgi:hypothetical protein